MSEPIEELKELELDVRPEFLSKVRRKIDRRRTSGQLVSFGWEVPRTLLREFAGALSQLPSLLKSEGKDKWK